MVLLQSRSKTLTWFYLLNLSLENRLTFYRQHLQKAISWNSFHSLSYWNVFLRIKLMISQQWLRFMAILQCLPLCLVSMMGTAFSRVRMLQAPFSIGELWLWASTLEFFLGVDGGVTICFKVKVTVFWMLAMVLLGSTIWVNLVLRGFLTLPWKKRKLWWMSISKKSHINQLKQIAVF